ncbi:MAG: cytochrome C [Desulfuromonadales bacterium]|nr:cytochrome C [Desulfuromonadales bacterium]MBN2791501.1 cytochrome C [Desulfuromonadales bacterium]
MTRKLTNLCLGFFFVLIFSATGVLAAPELSIKDCGKCHEVQPAEIEAAGAAHKDQINCLDCHTGHRPMSANNIPACAQCHEGTEHYALPSCMNCHNPHQPLAVVLEGELKAECLTCHTEQNAQLVANPSAHTEVSCNFCHAEKHGVVPACTECHEPHSADMGQKDCAVCHAAHEPTVLEYPATTQNILCAACHETAYAELLATTTKHRNVGCVECHANKHKTVPACADCHGMPHAAGMHAKFPNCGDCHNTAHDLNNLSK